MSESKNQKIELIKKSFENKLSVLKKNRDIILSKFRKDLEAQKLKQIRDEISKGQ